MGTIAARDCVRVLELTEQVVAALLITVHQGIWLRLRLNHDASQPVAAGAMNLGLTTGLGVELTRMMAALDPDVAVVMEDRRLEPDLRRLLERIQTQYWELYA